MSLFTIRGVECDIIYCHDTDTNIGTCVNPVFRYENTSFKKLKDQMTNHIKQLQLAEKRRLRAAKKESTDG